ncbi:MAG: PQQ-binding-like beta-propeller repeat protein [Saprospiraceae bacterium]|nr:PQQ-binding-like beta-propeller repeat protein [Saprospiraceae bacterium]
MTQLVKVCIFSTICTGIHAQNWSTFSGNNERSGYSKLKGPDNFESNIWKIDDAGQTTLGNAVYSFGDKFVTSRITFSPYKGIIECRDLKTGLLLWTSEAITNNSILYSIGFTYDAVYANDYSNGDIYALHPSTGKILWKAAEKAYVFGAYPGCVFACNGDPILGGEPQTSSFTKRLDKYTGKTKWVNKTIIAVTPNAGLACTNDKVYRITGGITIPITLSAIDINTGKTLFSSSPLKGDGDQENPITLGPDGMIYFKRDGGLLYAFRDNGSDFEIVWTYELNTNSGAAISGNLSLGSDHHIYIFDNGRILKLDKGNGSVLAATSIEFEYSQPSMTIDSDSKVYFNNGLGKLYILTESLQTIKSEINIPSNVYCNPSISKDGFMVLTQGGRNIQAFRNTTEQKCIADFRASSYTLKEGETVDFFDQSSNQALDFEWKFEGADIEHFIDNNPTDIKYSKAGIYSVRLIAQNKLGRDTVLKECLIEVLPSNTLVNNLEDENLFIYPNPVADILSIELEESITGANFYILDSYYSIKIRGNLTATKNTINLENLPSGMYYLMVNQDAIRTMKIIKL